MADVAFHVQKQSGPLAMLERAVATGEPARLALDANNFACLRQDYLGLRLPTKKNAQGDSRFLLDAAARHDLLEILEERYGRRSTMITSQLPVERWHEIIGDPTYADAILDRLVHNAHRIELAGESMRRIRGKQTRKA